MIFRRVKIIFTRVEIILPRGDSAWTCIGFPATRVVILPAPVEILPTRRQMSLMRVKTIPTRAKIIPPRVQIIFRRFSAMGQSAFFGGASVPASRAWPDLKPFAAREDARPTSENSIYATTEI